MAGQHPDDLAQANDVSRQQGQLAEMDELLTRRGVLIRQVQTGGEGGGGVGPAGPQGPIGPQGPAGASGAWTQLTQAAYNALDPKDPNTLYVIVG